MIQKQIFKPFKPVPHRTYTFKEIFKNYELTSINDLGIDYHDSHGGTTIYTISVQKDLGLAPFIQTTDPNTRIACTLEDDGPIWYLVK